MTKKISMVVLGSLCLASMSARAEPSVAPRVSEKVVGPAADFAIKKLVDIKAMPSSIACGAAYKVSVQIVNRSSEPWVGHGALTLEEPKSEGGPAEAITVAKGETKTVELASTLKLDCSKPLGMPVVRVGKTGATPTTIKVHPTTIVLERNFPQPMSVSGPPKPWLRRAFVTGGCGQAVTPTAWLMPPQSATMSQPVTIKLGFGGPPADLTTTVGPGPKTVMSPPVTLDCQAAMGIPPLVFVFPEAVAPAAPNGSISASSVSFDP